jgi:uncharacterized repeat protein (TIGR01451 family)
MCTSAGQQLTLSEPILLDGTRISADTPEMVAVTARHHGGEPLLIRLVDADRNIGSSVRDSVTVTIRGAGNGDAESVQLVETAPDSGVFTGHLPTQIGSQAVMADCVLQAAINSLIEVSYVDPEDPTDSVTASVLSDPVSRVFNALTGAPVDGARVILVNAATGAPASPLDDDGISAFPATLESGLDGIPGAYRFPVVPPGRYRLLIEPPPGYAAPSQQPEGALQGLDGAPWIISGASYADEFIVDTPLLRADIPVDPAAGTLFVDKRAMTESASVGDFIEFVVTVTHSGGLAAASDIEIVDDLPAGLRYAAGSARLLPEGAAIEPYISDDGRQMVFDLGELPVEASTTLRYVAAVVPGNRGRELENAAFARSGSDVSNTSTAVVRLTDELFTDRSFLAGRVLLASCDAEDPADSQGLAGARVYLEDGRFAVTDESGRYHFEGLRPGMHTAQLDLGSIPDFVELLPCDSDQRFAGSSFSRFVDLSPGALGRVDFYARIKPPPRGDAEIALQQTVVDDEFVYTARLSASVVLEPDKAELMVMLPDGVEYISGSARLSDGSQLLVRQSAQVLTMPLDALRSTGTSIEFAARPHPEFGGELATKALMRFESLGERRQTPVVETTAMVSPATTFSREYVLQLQFETLSAELRPVDLAALDTVADDWRGVEAIRILAVGHSDYLPISAAGQSLYSDNYELSYARARSVVTYLSESLDIDPNRITVEGVGPDRPVADNRAAAGRAQNRRVELLISGLDSDAPRTVEVLTADSGEQTLEIEGRAHAMPEPTRAAGALPDSTTVGQVTVPAIEPAGQTPGREILWPPEDFAPAIPGIRIVIKHAPGDRLNVTLNGEPVSALNFEGSQHSEDGRVALSRWRGVNLAEGGNQISVIVTDADAVSTTLERSLHFAGPPVRAELLLPESELVADGRTRPRLAVRFLDRWGMPARRDTVGFFSVEAPYRSWNEIERLRENSVIAIADQRPSFQVGDNGIAMIELEPTTRSGEVRLEFEYAREYPQEMRAWLKPAAREWILVGLAEGTLGYSEISDSMELAADAGLTHGYGDDGRIAFFAKGRVRGAVLTAAFDSDGDDDEAPLGGVIDPDRYYVLYGDNTEQRFDAASREKLYLRLERDAFSALFGDFETGMTITELSRYSRTLTGFQAEKSGEHVSFTSFAADTDQAFARDELRGNGTSGPYQLSRRFILSGSDKLRIEVRDRFRPERIISERILARHVDYDIDYNSGIVFFREPVASRDFAFDPVYVVVDYEIRDRSESSMLLGGRAAVSLASGASELGFSVVHEDIEGAPARLRGTDFRHQFGLATQLRAEYAESESGQPLEAAGSASAYLVQFEHQNNGRQLQAYVRETEEGFGLGQQRSTDSGTRRTGLQMRNEFSESWSLDAEAFRQLNLRDGAQRTVIESTGRFQDQRRVGIAGVRRIEENIPGSESASSQAILGGSWKFFDSLLTTRVNIEAGLERVGESVDYPSRALLGVDLTPGSKVTVFAEREVADGALFDSTMTRIGARTNPTERSRIDTSVSSEMTEFGPRNFANLGMNQGWNIGAAWVVDVGFERSKLLNAEPLARPDERVPLASGSLAGDFTSAFLGLGYRGADWTVTTRTEWRNSATDDQRALIGGFYREPESGHGFSAELNLIDRSSTSAVGGYDGRLRLGWARRPDGSRWIVYNRADWVASRQRADGFSSSTRRFVNQLNAHYRPDARQELALHHALKLVRSDFDEFRAAGVVNLLGVDWRRRLNARYDFGLHASWYKANALDVRESGLGIDVGFVVAQNMLMHVGYNFTGFEDADFASARYTSRGPFVRFSLKLDQASLLDILRR